MTDFEVMMLVIAVGLGLYILWTEFTKANHNK